MFARPHHARSRRSEAGSFRADRTPCPVWAGAFSFALAADPAGCVADPVRFHLSRISSSGPSISVPNRSVKWPRGGSGQEPVSARHMLRAVQCDRVRCAASETIPISEFQSCDAADRACHGRRIHRAADRLPARRRLLETIQSCNVPLRRAEARVHRRSRTSPHRPARPGRRRMRQSFPRPEPPPACLRRPSRPGGLGGPRP